MNEILFFLEIVVLVFFLLFSFKLGKHALIVFVVLQTIFANLFVTKQMEIFSLTVTCSDVYVVSAIFGLNLIQEYFGKAEAKKTINASFVFLILFMVVSKAHLLYIPAPSDTAHNSFQTVLSHTPRIVIASIVVFFLVQWFDLLLYGFLKKKFSQNSFVLRMGLTSALSQLLDTILFSFLGLYKIVDNIYHVIALSFFVKLITIGFWGIFMLSIKKYFKLKRENELL